MKAVDFEQLDPRVEHALDELRSRILESYPTASFSIGRDRDEIENVHLVTAVDLDDPFEVLDLVIDRVVQLQGDERIPLHVIPIRSSAQRVIAKFD